MYITLVRRNWHLLPYEQILELIDKTPEWLAFHLREDDFLFIKLGNVKPKCTPVVYSPLSSEEHEKLAAWRKNLEETLGGPMTLAGEEPRLAFVRRWQRGEETVTAKQETPSRFETRYAYSYFAVFGDPLLDGTLASFPEGQFQELQKSGVNGIWLHVVLRDLAPGGVFPEFGKDHERRIVNLKKLVTQAEKYGIRIFLYMNEPRAMKIDFFKVPGREEMRGVKMGEYYSLCTSNPEVRRWLSDSLAYVFGEVPGLGGIFTITASENQTNCASHGKWKECPRCGKRTDAEILAEVNAAMEEGVHRSAPQAKVFVWDWGWRGHGMAEDIIEKLPKNVDLLTVSEWGVPVVRGGVSTSVGEYSISVVGPGERAKKHWEAARRSGHKTAAKVQLGVTWEIASVPYVPAMDLVAEHCRGLAESGVNGLMMSWSLGGYPSPNLLLPRYFDRDPIPTVEEALLEMARERYGEGANLAREGWRKFSEGYREYPYGGSVMYTAPTQMGPANLLYATPTKYHATMVGIPYDDLNAWRWPYPPEVFQSQFALAGAKMREGAELLAQAAKLAPEATREGCRDDARYARVAAIHFLSVANQAEFIGLRDAERTPEVLRRLKERLQAETALALEEYSLVREDSRIGFESTNQYWFVPQDLVEKMVLCRYLEKKLP